MNEPRVINIVSHYSSLYGGNFIPSIFCLANKLKENGCNVIFTFPLEAKERYWAHYLQNNGFNVFFISFGDRIFKKELKKINKSNSVSVVYSHFISGLKMKALFLFSKTKLLIHVHSDFSGGKKISMVTRIKKCIERNLLPKKARYIFVSEDLFKDFNKSNSSIHLPNALCAERIPCKQTNIEEIKKKYDINEEDTVFLTFGWSPLVKGTDIVVKSYLRLNNKPNSKLIIVHGKNDGYEKCVKFLTSEIGNDEFLHNKNIVFLPPVEDVFSLYSISDVFISASRSEGFSYSVLEALYFNLNVICSDIVGTSWSKKYPNSTFFKSESVEELVQLLQKNIGYKKVDLINKQVLSDFSIDRWCDDVIDQLILLL